MLSPARAAALRPPSGPPLSRLRRAGGASGPDRLRPCLLRRRPTARSPGSGRRPGVRPGRRPSRRRSEPRWPRMGPSPAAFVRGFDPGRDAGPFLPFVHRWTRGRDLVALLVILRHMLDTAGRSEQFFLDGDDPACAGHRPGARVVLRARARGRGPAGRSTAARRAAPGRARASSRGRRRGSACKRLNLFLRWMVRRDAVDLGVWTPRVARPADRPARHARDPRRPVPRADAVRARRAGAWRPTSPRHCGRSTPRIR